MKIDVDRTALMTVSKDIRSLRTIRYSSVAIRTAGLNGFGMTFLESIVSQRNQGSILMSIQKRNIERSRDVE